LIRLIIPETRAGNITTTSRSQEKKNGWDRLLELEGEYLSRHDKWLCMMYRDEVIATAIADDGAIFISIDDTEMQV
jgi:adenine specific DNA methylase Mod